MEAEISAKVISQHGTQERARQSVANNKCIFVIRGILSFENMYIWGSKILKYYILQLLHTQSVSDQVMLNDLPFVCVSVWLMCNAPGRYGCSELQAELTDSICVCQTCVIKESIVLHSFYPQASSFWPSPSRMLSLPLLPRLLFVPSISNFHESVPHMMHPNTHKRRLTVDV